MFERHHFRMFEPPVKVKIKTEDGNIFRLGKEFSQIEQAISVREAEMRGD